MKKWIVLFTMLCAFSAKAQQLQGTSVLIYSGGNPLFTLSSAAMRYDSPTFCVDPVNNRVGLGSTTPQDILDITPSTMGGTGISVYETDSTTNLAAKIISSATNGTFGLYSAGSLVTSLGATNSYFDTNVLAVDGANNRVGIGTTAPAYAFQNEGVLWNKGIAYFGAHAGPTPSTAIEGGNSGGTSYLKFYTGAYGINYFFGTGSAGGTRNGIYMGCNGTTGQAILYFSDGAVSPTWDTNLYRSAANVLKTDDALTIGGNLTIPSSGVIQTATTGDCTLDPNPDGAGIMQLGVTGDNDKIYIPYRLGVGAGSSNPGDLIDLGTESGGITIDGDLGISSSGSNVSISGDEISLLQASKIYLGNGDASEDVVIKSENLIYDDTFWDDIRVPLETAKAPASGSPDYEVGQRAGAGGIGVGAWAFDSGTEQSLYFSVQLPHSYKEGTNIVAHVHCYIDNGATIDDSPSDDGDAILGIEYSWANMDAVFGTTTVLSQTHTFGASDDYLHSVLELGAITGTSKTVSSMLLCRVFRDADAGGDLYSDDVFITEVDFHYQIDAPGSAAVDSKF